MSLTADQIHATIAEFAENMRRVGASDEELADELGCSPAYVRALARLDARRIDDPWILRNLLIRLADERGVELVPFSALSGDYHRYWFLDGAYIDRGRL